MYSPHRLDTPPPTSHFPSRRPWSPEQIHYHTDGPRTRAFGQNAPSDNYNPLPSYGRRQREVSDVSVEALDLADYAMTLRPALQSDLSSPYQPFIAQNYPPPRPFRSLARRATVESTPSLVSAGASSSQSPSRSHPYTPVHRPFSLPPAFLPGSPPESQYGHTHYHPQLVETPNIDATTEADISSFPPWSRSWYDQEKPAPPSSFSHPYPYDPNASVHSQNNRGFSSQTYPSSDASHRNLLPWSGEERNSLPSVTAEMKQERLRMLEYEFGSDPHKASVEVEGNVVGGVNGKGNLVNAGPRKRIATRWIQGVFALAAAVASLYSALILKPQTPPPPQGRLPAYILYILSVLTVLLILYLFVFRPCCCSGKRRKSTGYEGPAGMMVLPVQGFHGAGKKKRNRDKRDRKRGTADGVQVNLIVDPSVFGSGGRSRDQEDDHDAADGYSEGRFMRGPKRRSIFEGLAMEEQWQLARSYLKRLLFIDVVVLVLWSCEFVLILMGKRCPAGQFDGWCDGYNVATALACFLAISFGLSVFFDIKDLYASKASPRTRT